MPTILLVDDSKTLLKLVQRMLAKAGYEVIPVSSGRQAVRLLQTTRVDLVLTDLYMPPPDGFELVDAVRALPQPPPVIVMSSHTEATQIFRGTQMLGAAASLTKPFTGDQLRDAVARVLGSSPTSREARVA